VQWLVAQVDLLADWEDLSVAPEHSLVGREHSSVAVLVPLVRRLVRLVRLALDCLVRCDIAKSEKKIPNSLTR